MIAGLVPSVVTAETRHWKSDVSGDWLVAGNWLEAALPAEGDNVVIPVGTRVDVKSSPPNLLRVTVEGTLILHGWETILKAEVVDVAKSGRICLPGSFREQSAASRMQIECADSLIVTAGGRISADASGFAGGTGAARDGDPTSAGFGPGGGTFPKVWGASTGGSYGGRGGTENSAAVYGSPRTPAEPGSGGGGGNGTGGAGGGSMRIIARTIEVDGTISANGGDVMERTWSGGGSGGSIWISTQLLSGHGRIEANGGWASVYAGGGGGGRIAVHGAQFSPSLAQPTYTAIGGGNGRCGVGVEQPQHFGEPGTIWFLSDQIPGYVPLDGGVVLQGEAAAPVASLPIRPGNQSTIAYLMPWLVNEPIAMIEKILFRAHQREHAAERTVRNYVGPNLELMESQCVEILDDVGENLTSRWSTDNGQTWSEPVVVQASNNVKYGDVTVWEGGCNHIVEPTTQRLVQVWLRQIQQGGLYHCFTYSRISTDLGRSWAEPIQLRYEDGPGFDPQQPLSEGFLNRNEGYPGNNILLHSSGVLVHCLAHTNAPGDPRNNLRPWRMGSRLMLGKWIAEKSVVDWTPGAAVEITPEQSARGLMEPEVAELTDARLLVVWRGSDQGWDGTVSTEPGRKWYSISADAGETLSLPQPWHYMDGSPFYSSSSFHRIIRHSVTGKLYWLGNLSAGPPRGNDPRYPLLIAEIDDATGTLRKQSVTTIDDRDELQHGFTYQLSNFSLLEDRQTHDLDIFLTTYGQVAGQENWNTADSYRYRLRLK